MQELEKIWMNGELIDWADAKIHVGSHGLHYGSGVFEGIRAYETPKGSAVFRLTDHLQRLNDSARLLNMKLGYSLEELRSACMELSARTVCGSATCGRSRSSGTASSASRRRGIPSMSRS